MHAWQIHQKGQHSEAEAIYREVLSRVPKESNAWCFLGIALHDQRRYDEAVEAYERALKLNPNFPVALNNLGNSLRYVQQLERADECFRKAIELKPDYLNAYKNRGTLHVWTGKMEQGLECYQQGLKVNPNEAELHRNLGVIYLLQGRFEEGWEEYRWRWKVGDLHRPFSNVAVWKGQEIKGRTILLSAEQGLGDTFNFVRFARVLRELGAKTIVSSQHHLLPLLGNSPELGPTVPNNQPFTTPIHYQCSLLDVADVLKISLDSIPRFEQYLKPNEELLGKWTEKMSATSAKLRIGISWQGNPDHQADMFRSFPLKSFEPLSEIDGVELWSLQAGFGTEQLQTWKGSKSIRTVEGLDSNSGAFMDSAAIMKSLDLFITSDTALAHLGGALGVPTWIALNYMPDWRWLLERDDSPWYPSIRLFRQTTMGDWHSVFQRICSEIRILVNSIEK